MSQPIYGSLRAGGEPCGGMCPAAQLLGAVVFSTEGPWALLNSWQT